MSEEVQKEVPDQIVDDVSASKEIVEAENDIEQAQDDDISAEASGDIDSDEDLEQEQEPEDINELPLPESRPKSKDHYIKNRILKKKEKELEAERREKEELLRMLQQKNSQQGQYQQPQQGNESPPLRSQYENEDDYIDARTQYNLDMRDKKARELQAKQHTENLKRSVAKKFEDMNDRGSRKYEDYEEVIAPMYDQHGDFPTNEAMAAAIWNSEYDVDLNYFLASNLNHARKIAELPPLQAQKKIWEIEQRFAKSGKGKSVKPKAKVIEPISTNAGNHTKDIMKMTKSQRENLYNNNRAEWNRLYKEQFKKKLY